MLRNAILPELMEAFFQNEYFRTGQGVYSSFHYNSPVLSCEDAWRMLGESLTNTDPLMICRWGSNEMAIVIHSLRLAYELADEIPPQAMDNLCYVAGFFPQKMEMLPEFSKVMLDSFRLSDITGVWCSPLNPLEDIVVNTFCPESTLVPLRTLSPAEAQRPWTRYLAGKRVLVVHPFVESIKRQYARRGELFLNPHVLPEFELLTLKAVQSQAQEECPYPSWFEALDAMKLQMDTMDYDIALIGAGAYGMPLAAHARNCGKIGVHLGGALQLMFGIMGRRWEGRAFHGIEKLWRLENWVRPLPEETPTNYRNVEGGCYW